MSTTEQRVQARIAAHGQGSQGHRLHESMVRATAVEYWDSDRRIETVGSVERVLDATYPVSNGGLSRQAYGTLDAAQMKTAWGRVIGDDSRWWMVPTCSPAPRSTTLWRSSINGRCGFAESARSSVSLHTAGSGDAEELVDRLLDQAARNGAVMALLFSEGWQEHLEPNDFEAVSIADVEFAVTESSRRRAPMTLIRGGEERDLAAIVDIPALFLSAGCGDVTRSTAMCPGRVRLTPDVCTNIRRRRAAAPRGR